MSEVHILGSWLLFWTMQSIFNGDIINFYYDISDRNIDRLRYVFFMLVPDMTPGPEAQLRCSKY